MLLSTTPTIEGRRILEYKGVVTGETIVGANVLKDFMASLSDFSAAVAVRMKRCCAKPRNRPCAKWKSVPWNWALTLLWALTLTMRQLGRAAQCLWLHVAELQWLFER